MWCDEKEMFCCRIGLSPEDPRWVGAWWIGFLISGTLALLLALPLSGFPKSLPGNFQVVSYITACWVCKYSSCRFELCGAGSVQQYTYYCIHRVIPQYIRINTYLAVKVLMV